MGGSAIFKMVEDAFYNRFFIVDGIVSDNDSAMRAVLNHPLICVRVQVMKTPKGKLDEKIPEPSFLADPSHCVKVVAKHIFSIVNESRAQRRGWTKADALRINKEWGYMIKKNREKTIEELSESIVFSLFFFIVYPQSFLIRRASALVHPHRWALLSLRMENMFLAKTFTQYEGNSRKDGYGVS